MAEKLKVLKFQLWGDQATPAPPVGPALGDLGVDVGRFCRQFNDRTMKQSGAILPVVVTVYDDKSFSFVVKQPTTAYLLKQAVEVRKGSRMPNREKVGSITRLQLKQIAITKMPDLNTRDLQKAEKIIAGTARSMGIEII